MYAAESSSHFRALLQKFIEENDLAQTVQVIDLDLEKLAEKSFDEKVCYPRLALI